MPELKKVVFSSILFICLLSNCNFAFSQINDRVEIDPAVDAIYSGPIKWNDKDSFRNRVVVLLSEVYLHMYVQKIEYGSENCCAKVVSSIKIDFSKLLGSEPIYDIIDLTWLNSGKFQFKGDSQYYIVEMLDDGSYTIKQR